MSKLFYGLLLLPLFLVNGVREQREHQTKAVLAAHGWNVNSVKELTAEQLQQLWNDGWTIKDGWYIADAEQ